MRGGGAISFTPPRPPAPAGSSSPWHPRRPWSLPPQPQQLLHGGGDDQTGWVQFGEVLHIADKAIREGIATPMIIVMPDANTGKRGYFNDIKGEWRYEDFFFEELMPFVEKMYRIKKEKRYRAVLRSG